MRRALIVDLFSTLVPGGEDEREVVNREMARVLGVEPDAFTREFDAAAYERFIGAYGDLPSTLRVIARRSGGDPTDEEVHQATVLRRQLARQLLGAAPAGTLGALAELRSSGWRIGLAFSAEVGAAKPEPAIYLAACNALGVAPADCVYVGDGMNDELPGAAALGMYAIRTTEHADSDPGWTGPTVTSFTELPALIGRPART